MNCDFILTRRQQALVEDNLLIIDKAISWYIHLNEGLCGMGRDDLYQEGAVALCKAANISQRNLPTVSLSEDNPEDGRPPPFPEPSVPDAANTLIAELDVTDLLSDCKRRYSGVARLGVEALELKIKGLTGADIARLYGAKPNQVGAWISRAAQKIRKDYMSGVENRPSRL